MALLYRIASTLGLVGSAKQFRVRVHVVCLNESITVDGITESTLVRQLKERIEEIAGIPGSLQDLYYLDRCCLFDDYPLSHFEIISDAKLVLRMRHPFTDIVKACSTGDSEWLQTLLPLQKDYPLSESTQYYIYVAAFVAAHCGHAHILDIILQTSVNLKRKLPSGRHPLLVSVKRRHLKSTEAILGRRIKAYEWNKDADNLCSWEIQSQRNRRMEKIKLQGNPTETVHQTVRFTKSQTYDSKTPTWLGGSSSKKYMCVILDDTYPTTTVCKNKPAFKF